MPLLPIEAHRQQKSAQASVTKIGSALDKIVIVTKWVTSDKEVIRLVKKYTKKALEKMFFKKTLFRMHFRQSLSPMSKVLAIIQTNGTQIKIADKRTSHPSRPRRLDMPNEKDAEKMRMVITDKVSKRFSVSDVLVRIRSSASFYNV